MSYNGKIPKDERSSNDLINEVYSTVLMANSMLETVAEMREKSQSLKNIDLQIGIHTGRILGGLIG